MTLRVQLLPILVSCFAIGLSSCQFKKGGTESTAAQPQNTQGENPQTKGPQNIFEALASLDQKAALAYISSASIAELNSYSDEGKTPLTIAAEGSKIFLVDALLKGGALPLKPNKGNETNAYTAALQNPNQNKEVIRKIETVVAGYKEKLTFLTANFVFAEAYAFAAGVSFDLSEPVAHGENFLDLVYRHRAGNMLQALSITIQTLPVGATPKTVKNLWALAFEAQSKPLAEKLIKNGLLVEDSALAQLLSASEVPWRITVLKALNENERYVNLNLSAMHLDYIKFKIEGLKTESLKLDDLKRDLALFERNSLDKSFCSKCVPFILEQRAISSVRLLLIKALIETSTGTDPNLLASMIGPLAPLELADIIKSMTPEMRKQQTNLYSAALEGTDFSDLTILKIDVLKSAGFAVAANESRAAFTKLFSSMNEDQDNARIILEKLAKDFKKLGSELRLSKRELQILASQEFFKIISKKRVSFDFLALLVNINGSKFDSILIANGDKSDPTNDTRVSIRYLLERENYEGNISLISLGDLNVSLANYFFSSDNAIWFNTLNKNGIATTTIFSSTEMILVSLFQNELSEDIEFRQEMLRLKNLISKNLSSNLNLSSNIFDLLYKSLSAENKNKILDRFFRIIAKSEFSAKSQFFTSYFIRELDFNFKNDSNVIPSLLSQRVVDHNNDSNSLATIKNLKEYLLRNNPRIFVAQSYENGFNDYRSFVSGQLSSDPLCIGGEPATKRILEAYKKLKNPIEISEADLVPLKGICQSGVAVNNMQAAPVSDKANPIDEYQARLSLEKIVKENARRKAVRAEIYTRYLANERVWMATLQKLRSQMSSYQFDNLDLFGLKSSDLEIKFYEEAKSFPSGLGN